MITLGAKAVVALIALGAIGLASLISRWIRRRGGEVSAEAGTGDAPGSRERGPGGMRM